MGLPVGSKGRARFPSKDRQKGSRESHSAKQGKHWLLGCQVPWRVWLPSLPVLQEEVLDVTMVLPPAPHRSSMALWTALSPGLSGLLLALR